MTSVVSFGARRWLSLFAAACLAVLFVACGGGGGTAPEPYDAGSPERQPWRTLFATGSDTRTLTGTGCVITYDSAVPSDAAPTVTFTLTLGTSSFTVTAAVGTASYAVSFDPRVSSTVPAGYGLNVLGGTSTLVNIIALDLRSTLFSVFDDSPDAMQQQVIFQANVDGAGTVQIHCDNVDNPITKASLNNFVPQERIASFLAGTPTGTVSSALTAQGSCALSGGPIGTYTYAVSPQGQIQIDGTTLPTNWLDSVATSQGYYSEFLLWQGDAYMASMSVGMDSLGRGFDVLRRSVGASSEFSQRCSRSELMFIGGFL